MACVWCKSNDHLGVDCPERFQPQQTDSPDPDALARHIVDKIRRELGSKFVVRYDGSDVEVRLDLGEFVAAGWRFHLEYYPDEP